MGAEYGCTRVESEEERITKIMSSMALVDINSTSAYTEFLKCINERNELDFFLFHKYLQTIIGDNLYDKLHNEYFKNISKDYKQNKNVKKIGSVIIMHSKSYPDTKIDLLFKHFVKFYIPGFENYTLENLGNLNKDVSSQFNLEALKAMNYLKEFVTDIANSNTCDCISSFQLYNQAGNAAINIHKMWQNSKIKFLVKHIIMNLDKLKTKLIPNNDIKNTVSDSFLYDTVIEEMEGEKNLLPIVNESKNSFCSFKVIAEFIELSFPQLGGDYIRNFLYEEYMKENN